MSNLMNPMTSELGLHNSAFAKVVALQNQRTLIDLALKHWTGGTILQIGLADPIAAIELARRGVRIVGIDESADRVARAEELAKTGCAGTRFDNITFVRGAAADPA